LDTIDLGRLRIQVNLLSALICLGLAFVLIPAQVAVSRPGGATAPQNGPVYTVNDPADPGDPACTETNCSLRAAITAASAGDPSIEHAIDFDLTYPVTITLSSPLPAITGTVVISGPGSTNLSVSGNGLYRVLEVGSGARLDLSGVAVRQGYDPLRGGGIFIDHGRLSLVDSLIADNLAGSGDGGGLHNDGGTVGIVTTTFAGNLGFHDGGIANNGVMTVTESLFTGNHARLGGAIENLGALTVTNSTFTENVAPQISGGAIQNGGTLVVANSTFFDNGSTTGADIANSNGVVYVTNSTFTSATLPSLNSVLSVGISGTVTLQNTLLAAGPGIENCATLGGGTVAVDPSNLATDSTCIGASEVTLESLKLAPLQNNGGATPTVALYTGSLAVDAGDDGLCTAPIGAPDYGAGAEDQRGVTRPQGAHCDVGAYESWPIRTLLPSIR
jgi:hypothetical protein